MLAKQTYPYHNGGNLDIHVRSKIDHAAWTQGSLPLLDRGWAFQEHLLSQRLVHFTEQEIFWECKANIDCECTTIRNDPNSFKSDVSSPKNFTHSVGAAGENLDGIWCKIVEQYTRRQLTFEKDIYPALQGISKHIHHQSLYLAGYVKKQHYTWLVTALSRQPEEYKTSAMACTFVVLGIGRWSCLMASSTTQA
jgi:hypothetical protein